MSKKRQIITTAAVVLVIALIVTATVVANKKQDSTDIAADTSATTSTTPTPATATANSDDCDENGNKLRGDGSVDDDGEACETTSTTTPTPAPATSSTSGYKDGTYTASGSYQSPGGSQGITVKVTLTDGKVTDSTVTSKASDAESEEYQDKFIAGYKTKVTGKSIDAISLSRVSGGSLTSQGFNNAITNIKNQAKA